MLKIEFIDDKKFLDSNQQFYKRIIVNGIYDYQSDVEENLLIGHLPKEPGFVERIGRLYNDEAILEILKYDIGEIRKHFIELHCLYENEGWPDSITIQINCVSASTTKPSIHFFLEINSEHWIKAWSIFEFRQAVEDIVRNLNDPRIITVTNNKMLWNGIIIAFNEMDLGIEVGKLVNEAFGKIKEIIEAANKYLISVINQDNLLTFFDFPGPIRTACKQYLIYFIQFLADIGYEAEAELKEESSKTMFKVIPKDGRKALGNIRAALEVYLSAPGNPNTDIQANSKDIAALQWQANIMHLESQITLAKAVLEAKDATIESLQLSNYQYRQLISNKPINTKNDEDIIPGIVSVDKFTWKGFSVNFAEILRRLKRKKT